MSGKSKDTTLTDSIMAFFSPREFRKLKAEEARPKPKQAVLLRQTDNNNLLVVGTKNMTDIVIGTPASHRWVKAMVEGGVDVYITK